VQVGPPDHHVTIPDLLKQRGHLHLEPLVPTFWRVATCSVA
jgi:hypothetical protein